MREMQAHTRSIGTKSLISDWHRVGVGLSVRFHFCECQIDVEWLTRPPTGREIRRPKILARYRKARHAFLTAVAELTGMQIVVVEG